MKLYRFFLISVMGLAVLLGGCTEQHSSSQADKLNNDARWWPVQKVPAGIVRTTPVNSFEAVTSPNGKPATNATHILAQSVSGLTAQAVNAGKLDELVWIDSPQGLYPLWYEETIKHIQAEERGVFTPWQLVERYRELGIVKGYVLYSYDHSEGGLYEEREGEDHSVNVATTLAGLMGGILIEEGQEARAKQMGLEKLFDARGRTEAWVLDTFGEMLNRKLLLTIDPKVANNRAMAVAHRTMAIYGTDEPLARILEWMEPGSPVMGWNSGNEDHHTKPLTHWGHFQTASNWAMNLPLLSAGSETYRTKPVRNLDPRTIDYDRGRHFTTFLMSDGDNLQWLLGNFCDNESFWANPHNGDFGFGWTVCAGHLNQMCPPVLEYLSRTQPEAISLSEHGAGYYYPDEFAKERPDRLAVLRDHARKISVQLQESGVKVFSFICQDVDSEEAKAAYRVYAEELEGIAGMIALQYYPYDGGDGQIFWFENKQGVDIPVVTAKFSTWNHARWPRGGTPAKVARMTNEYAAEYEKQGLPSFSVTANHAWSMFQYAPGDDEMAENTSRDPKEARQQGGVRGLTPVKWIVDRLDDDVHAVSPEELLWRVRMEYRPRQTQRLLENGDF